MDKENDSFSEKNVEKAIDDIFESNFFESDLQKTTEGIDVYQPLTLNSSQKDNQYLDAQDNMKVEQYKGFEEIHEIEKLEEFQVENQEETKPQLNIVQDTIIDVKPVIMEPVFENVVDIQVPEVEKKGNESHKSKNIINIFIYVFLIIITVVFIIYNVINLNVSNDKTMVCSLKVEDGGYKVTDEYEFNYVKDKITYASGLYIYHAKTDEFRKQVEIIKSEKTKVIINSNGMSGFTHNLESSNDTLKVNSYYDFELINFNAVDKNNNKVKPLSYIDITSKTTLDSMKKNLEKSGYECIVNK
ncbi:MAG: hypothetical protein RSA10_03905 [Bacilli bacterium]